MCLRRSWRDPQQSPHLRPGSHSWALPCLCYRHAMHGHVPCWSRHSPWPIGLTSQTEFRLSLSLLAWPALDSVRSDLLTATRPAPLTSFGCCGVVSLWGICLVYLVTLSIPLFFPCRVQLYQYCSRHLWNLFFLSVWQILISSRISVTQVYLWMVEVGVLSVD